jgi:hypothetical protein
MPQMCSECGGQVKRGILGAECRSCGFIVDGIRTDAPCTHGARVAGINRCNPTLLPEEQAGDVYQFRLSSACPMDDRCPAFEQNKSIPVVETKTAAWGQWCAYLADNGKCSQILYEMDDAGLFVPETARTVIVGQCPYKGDVRSQKECTIAAPDPSWPIPAWLPIDDFIKSAAHEVVAHWNDVRDKAVRLRETGRVTLLRNDAQVIAGTVRGDTGTYDVVLNRDDPESWSISLWSCGCKWSEWAFKRETYQGRMCSHATAMLFEAQADKMRGPGSSLWQHQYTAQAITPEFKSNVQQAVEAAMGKVDFLTVRFSEHWSQRVLGEFTCLGEKFTYEYTRSTGRLTVQKISSPLLSESQVEPYTERTATRFHTYTEQQVLQDESLGQLARNIGDINTSDTHYRVDDIRLDDVGSEDDIEGLFW